MRASFGCAACCASAGARKCQVGARARNIHCCLMVVQVDMPLNTKLVGKTTGELMESYFFGPFVHIDEQRPIYCELYFISGYCTGDRSLKKTGL